MHETIPDLREATERCEDLTVVIPTFDRARYITACLDQFQQQELDKIKFIICDTGSQDGTPELLEAQIKNGWWKPPCFTPEFDIRLIRLPEIKGKGAGVIAAMEVFKKEVTTEFMFRIEADILIPPNALKTMVRTLKDDPEIGMLAIPYSPKKDHVPTDCTMWRTEDVKAIEWQWTTYGCDCIHARNQLNGLGKKSIFHPTLQSRNLGRLQNVTVF